MKKTLSLALALVMCLTMLFSAVAIAEEPVTISFLQWGIGTVEENGVVRQRIAEFTARTGIQVDIIEVPTNPDGKGMDYVEFMTTLASQQQLPDAYMSASIPDTVSKGWARAMNDYAENDAQYQTVVKALRDGGIINGNIYAIPASMHMCGLAQNLTLMEELNLDPLPYNYTFQDLLDMLTATTTATTKGIYSASSLVDTGVFSLDPSKGMGWFTFDGTEYHLDSPEFAEVINAFCDAVAKGQVGHSYYSPDASWLPEGMSASQGWGEGLYGLNYMATYELGKMMKGELPFEADLFPLPNETMVVLPDNYFVGANTQHPAEAYALISWLTFDRDGMLFYLDVIERTEGASFSGVPINAGTIPEVDEFFLAGYANMPNFINMYYALSEKPENVVMEIYKTEAGYTNSRWYAKTGVTVDGTEKDIGDLIIAILQGKVKLADYASELNRIANQAHTDALEVLKDY